MVHNGFPCPETGWVQGLNKDLKLHSCVPDSKQWPQSKRSNSVWGWARNVMFIQCRPISIEIPHSYWEKQIQFKSVISFDGKRLEQHILYIQLNYIYHRVPPAFERCPFLQVQRLKVVFKKMYRCTHMIVIATRHVTNQFPVWVGFLTAFSNLQCDWVSIFNTMSVPALSGMRPSKLWRPQQTAC